MSTAIRNRMPSPILASPPKTVTDITFVTESRALSPIRASSPLTEHRLSIRVLASQTSIGTSSLSAVIDITALTESRAPSPIRVSSPLTVADFPL